MFAERTFHICEANISPRSGFTCPNGQISLGDLLYSRSPNAVLFVLLIKFTLERAVEELAEGGSGLLLLIKHPINGAADGKLNAV